MYYKNIFKYDEMKRTEHMAVRRTVGWYYWTHQLIEISGPDVVKFLDYLYPNDIGSMPIGKDRYTTMLNDDGEIIDDVVIMRMDEDRFWISTLFLTYTDDWIYYHSEGYDIDWTDITSDWNMYAVQGPRSKEMINSLVEKPIDDLKFFSHEMNKIGDIEVMINRSGFTGEKFGYEIYCHEEDTDALEDIIRETAPKFDGKQVTEFQIMAWTLPTESGFYYMRDLAHTNPLEVGLDANINWEKDFIGKAALLKVKENGPAREMVGFETLDDDIYIRSKQYGGPGEAVYIDNEEEEVGRVSKMVYSYVKEVNNGYILAQKGKLKIGDRIKIHGYDCVITEKKWL